MNSNPIVEVRNLVKVYPGGTVAVAGIDFDVGEGVFFGFLGPNGAGKSTTMKIVCTLLRKTEGSAKVAGFDIDEDPRNVRRRIGFAMQEVGLDDLATGRDFLVLQGLLYGMSGSESGRRADELLELVGLTTVSDRKVGTYSGGMRRRIDLVGALMHRPPVLFLDEPTTGLDPQSRLAIWEYLLDLNRDGTTIFLTTQMMDEADRLCGRLAIIDLGEIVAEGTPEELKDQVGGDVVRLGFDQGVDGAVTERAERILSPIEWVERVDIADSTLAVSVADGHSRAPDILRTLHEGGIPVADMAVSSPSLDDVFLKHTGRTIRAEETSGEAEEQMWRPWLGLKRR